MEENQKTLQFRPQRFTKTPEEYKTAEGIVPVYCSTAQIAQITGRDNVWVRSFIKTAICPWQLVRVERTNRVGPSAKPFDVYYALREDVEAWAAQNPLTPRQTLKATGTGKGQEWASMEAASRQTGIPVTTLRRMAKDPTFPQLPRRERQSYLINLPMLKKWLRERMDK